MAKAVNSLTARVGALIPKRVEYRGWDTDLDAFLAKRLGNPRPTKLKAIEWLAQDSSLGPSFTLLDVGCGPGVFGHLLQNSTLSERIRYTGLDQSTTALEFARRTLPKSYDFQERDVLKEGLPEGSFDAIVVNEVLEHVPHYRPMLELVLAKKPKVLVVTSFAILPERPKDRLLWNSRYKCYMNSYSFGRFHQYLRETTRRPLAIMDFGTKADTTTEFPQKALILFYLSQGKTPRPEDAKSGR